MTHEEHETRAMLMGLRYHHGNGDPFYYKPDEHGHPYVTTMVDANTLKPMVVKDVEDGMTWAMPAGRRAHKAFIDDALVERDKRVLARKKP